MFEKSAAKVYFLAVYKEKSYFCTSPFTFKKNSFITVK